MDEFTSTLVKKFNFKPKYVRKLKYMYICSTDKGAKIIKPVNYNCDKILFVHKIKQHLKDQGFNQIDFYHISDEGMPYVINENIMYVMTDYIESEELNLQDIDNVKSSIELIATFHKLSQGSQKRLDESELMFINFKEDFKKKIDILKKIRKTISKQKNLTDFDVLFIKNYNYFYENAIESLEIIDKTNYDIINKIAAKNIMICHNKIKEENIIIGDKSYITNLENITIDHFIYDLSSFILRYIRKHGDNYLSLEQILNTYSKINYIDNSLLPILYAFIKFPSRYIDTCQMFFEKKRTFVPIYISSQIQNILELKDFHSDFISKIKPNKFF